MMIGKKNPKRPDTAGGNTPETTAKEAGEIHDTCVRQHAPADAACSSAPSKIAEI